MITPYTIQSNINYVDESITACERAKQSKKSVGVFKDRQGQLHVQNVTPNSLRYFGRNGLLFVARVEDPSNSGSVAKVEGAN